MRGCSNCPVPVCDGSCADAGSPLDALKQTNTPWLRTASARWDSARACCARPLRTPRYLPNPISPLPCFPSRRGVPPHSPCHLELDARPGAATLGGSEGDGTQREGLVTYAVRVAWPNRLYAAWSGALDLEDGAWGPPRGCVRHRVAALQCDSGELRHVDNWRMRQRRPHSRQLPWRAEGRPTAGRAAGCPARSARWGALAAQTVG